jgi:16S rRNA (cytidine1402-2'-O)-methyltransferase
MTVSDRHLHLIPVGLGEVPTTAGLPEAVRALAARLDVYIAENAKTARAFLKLVGLTRPIQDIIIHVLSSCTKQAEIIGWLNTIAPGGAMGLVSEAGCPAVADPGAKVVEAAHALGICVRPHVGPSSILLGLMASGLNGQQFAFQGYAPINAAERTHILKTWEAHSAKHAQTQILIETPYRNMVMYESLVTALKANTRLCVARSLTTAQEWVKTRTVAQWQQQPKPELDKHPTIFLFGASK